MNRIILETHELDATGLCHLTDARAEHLKKWLHVAPGRSVKVGILNGAIGWAEVIAVEGDVVTLKPNCTEPAPEPWFDLLIALPRPRAVKRLWAQMAAMGVRTIYLTAAEKVEKSYFSSHALDEGAYKPLLIDGLMQAGTTRLPQVCIIPKFNTLTDFLPSDQVRFLAHPHTKKPDFTGVNEASIPLVAIGPDGGWTDAECATFFGLGFRPFSLGRRPLRTDTAAIAVVAVLQQAVLS